MEQENKRSMQEELQPVDWSWEGDQTAQQRRNGSEMSGYDSFQNIEGTVISEHEDGALKTTIQFFADEMLPLLQIEGKVKGIAPTELVHLELKKLYEDFNLIMEDDSWKHFEFQSTNEGLKGLKRFRTYEAVASYQHEVPITTYVLYSGEIKNPMTEFSEGVNTYRVVPIIMQEKNADKLIAEIRRKLDAGEPVVRADLVQLALCPLMGGEMSQKERIKAAFAITKEAEGVEKEDVRKIEAVLYTMADKFLESMDMKEIMEDVKMTRLGRMLVEDGKAEGRKEERNRVNYLIKFLAEQNRTNDILKAAEDERYQEKLFAEFNL